MIFSGGSSFRLTIVLCPHQGTTGLTPLPNSLLSTIRSPLNALLMRAILGEIFRIHRKRGSVAVSELERHDDMSVDSFLSLHFGPQFARILGSALIHGIYATDSRLVSMRAAFPSLFQMAGEQGTDSIIVGTLKSVLGFANRDDSQTIRSPYECGNLEERMRDASVYSFRDGLATLTNALESHIARARNVSIIRDEDVSALRKDKNTGDFIVRINQIP